MMWIDKFRAGALLALIALCGGSVSSAAAQDFFQGKTIRIVVGFSAGGGFDAYSRTIARHIGRHIPGNPAVVGQNMAGAGSLRLANFMYAVAPKDGTAFATMGRGAAFGPLFGQPGTSFDAQKFTWLGSANNEVSLCASWHTSGIRSVEDLTSKELIIGATGPSDETATVPKAINGVLGTRIKVKTVEISSPPKSTLPKPRYSSLPAPGKSTRGAKPNTVVIVVMKIGRMRLRTLSKTAGTNSKFSVRISVSDWCTSRIGLLTTVPIKITNPSMVSTSNVCGTPPWATR